MRTQNGITVYTTMPKNWKFDKGAATAPAGSKWITNGKSRFAKDEKNKRKSGLLITDKKLFDERMKKAQTQNAKRLEQALKLRDELDKVSKEHEKYVNSQLKKQTDSDAVFSRKDDRFSAKEDKAYRKYYEHMNKDFNGSDIDKAILSGKYKDKFMDKRLINDLYKSKQKGAQNGQKTTSKEKPRKKIKKN